MRSNVNVNVDLSSLSDLADDAFMNQLVDRIAEQLAKKAKAKWIALAQSKLKTSRKPYIRAIRGPKRVGPGHYVVWLQPRNEVNNGDQTSFVPMAVELGMKRIGTITRVRQLLKGKEMRAIPLRGGVDRAPVGIAKIFNKRYRHPKWRHPGIKARNLAQEVYEYMATVEVSEELGL